MVVIYYSEEYCQQLFSLRNELDASTYISIVLGQLIYCFVKICDNKYKVPFYFIYYLLFTLRESNCSIIFFILTRGIEIVSSEILPDKK